eukprot:165786-Pyramimonas_sp.AAC.1
MSTAEESRAAGFSILRLRIEKPYPQPWSGASAPGRRQKSYATASPTHYTTRNRNAKVEPASGRPAYMPLLHSSKSSGLHSSSHASTCRHRNSHSAAWNSHPAHLN